MAPLTPAVVLSLFGVVIAFYLNMNKRIDETSSKIATRQDDLEDCVEEKLVLLTREVATSREAQHDWQQIVVQRLTAIETHLKGGIK